MAAKIFGRKDGATHLHPLGALYARSTLDSVIELAGAVARDFQQRRADYAKVDRRVKQFLEACHSQAQGASRLPTLRERTLAYGPFVDPFIGKDPATMCASEVALRKTAATWVEGGPSAGRSVRTAFADAAFAFAHHLRGLEYLTESEEARAAAEMFDNAVAVLRSGAVAGLFGRKPPQADNWPMLEIDDDGSALVVAISAELRPGTANAITIHEFEIVQRLARLRAEAVTAAMALSPGDDDEDRLQEIADAAYRWEKTVEQCLLARAVRAWRSVDYRALLAGEEVGPRRVSPAGSLVVGDGGLAELDLARLAAASQ